MNERAAAQGVKPDFLRGLAASLVERQKRRRHESLACALAIGWRRFAKPFRRSDASFRFGGVSLDAPFGFGPPAPDPVKSVTRLRPFLELRRERVAHKAIPAIFRQARFFVPLRFSAADNYGVARARQRHIEKAPMLFF